MIYALAEIRREILAAVAVAAVVVLADNLIRAIRRGVKFQCRFVFAIFVFKDSVSVACVRRYGHFFIGNIRKESVQENARNGYNAFAVQNCFWCVEWLLLKVALKIGLWDVGTIPQATALCVL